VVWGTQEAGGASEVRSWGLTAKLRLSEADGGLLALAWDCLRVAPGVCVPVSWLAGAAYSQCVWLPWADFSPFFEGCFLAQA